METVPTYFLGGVNVACLRTLLPTRDIEGHLLAFLQTLKAIALNSRKMGKEVFPALARRNKTKTLCIVKPLDCTCRHILNLRSKRGLAPGWGDYQDDAVKNGGIGPQDCGS